MKYIFIESIEIKKVMHLTDIVIPLSVNNKKNLVITGKNGSGKTSLLNAIAGFLDNLSRTIRIPLSGSEARLIGNYKYVEDDHVSIEESVSDRIARMFMEKHGLSVLFNLQLESCHHHFEKGEYILAFYKATRKFEVEKPKHVEKVILKNHYGISESPRSDFVKYILDLKVTEALAITSGKKEKAESIRYWFENFDRLLKQIFEDDSVKLEFDESTFAFTIHQDGREPFDFNTLSDGYAAILDIVVDLMLRMEKQAGGNFRFDMPGIVLIDEIETHLHLELQKHIMDFLNSIFPNIQFIVTTHSPFVLSSAKNAVIFDLENHTLVQDGLTGLPYDGVVRGYFGVDDLSNELRQKFERYRELVTEKSLTDDDFEELASLETYLDEIPDYLALGITTEYRRLKAEFESREDLDDGISVLEPPVDNKKGETESREGLDG